MDGKTKLKIYTLLGAEQFQKVVFILEKLKYQIIQKFFPNIKVYYEKQCDKQFLRRIRKQHIVDEKTLLREYQKQKLVFRKELVYKQNRNYHYDPNYPTRFIKYLEMNKKIHQRGMKKNIIIIVIIGITTFMLGNPFPVFSGICALAQVLSLVINFECVNLQNYNLCRFQNKRMYSCLKRLEDKKLESNLKNLQEGIVPVSQAINSQIQIPSIDEIVNNITTREQAVQLLEYVKEQYSYLQELHTKQEQEKRIGGRKNV